MEHLSPVSATTLWGRPGRKDLERLVVLVVLVALVGMVLLRFAALQEKVHTAASGAVSGAFSAAIQITHAKWLVQGGGESVRLEDATVGVNARGWPAAHLTLPMTAAGCMEVWKGMLKESPPIVTGFRPGTDGWGALAVGSLCGYVYQVDTDPIRLFIYNTANGSVQPFVL